MKEKMILAVSGMTIASLTTIVVTSIVTSNGKKKEELKKFEEELMRKNLKINEKELKLKEKIEASKLDIKEKEEDLKEKERLINKLDGIDKEALELMANIHKDLREIKQIAEYARQEIRISNSVSEYESKQRKGWWRSAINLFFVVRKNTWNNLDISIITL